MGNRFRDLTQYHLLIRGHGIVAALTFLLIVPSAIMIARFYGRSPRWALRLHIWLQILTVALTTVVFVLGWFAVGPERSLTNPHHGIGLAIYVLVLTQAIGGWWVHGREKGRRRMFIPLKLMFHQWLGRMIALLGLAQIPLGLTLYGSPAALFVLYALAAFALLAAYFVLTYVRGRRIGYDYDSQESYGTGSEIIDGQRKHRGLGNVVKATAAGAALTALLRGRSRSRSRNRSQAEVVGFRRPSGSYIEEEKYSQYGRDPGRESGGWTDRLVKIAGVAGAATLAKSLFDRRKDRQRDSDVRRHKAPHGGAQSISEDSLARLEEGRPLPSRQHPLNQRLNPPLNPPLNHRRSHSSLSYDSYLSDEGAGGRGHRLRDGIATLGAAGLLRNVFKNRRERKEQRRVEELRRRELEEERIARANSQGRYTGDGFPRRTGRRGSLTTSTDFTGSTNTRPRPHLGVPPPIPAGVVPAGVGGVGAGAALPNGHPRGHTTLGPNNPVITGAVNQAVNMPPIPPDPQGILHHDTSGSEAYMSAGGRPHRRHHSGGDGLAAGGLAAAESNRHHSTGEDSVASPPVSVKVKMHRDGRHVTLRRLPEEEAAAEREARRREKHGKRHRRRSASSLGGTDGGDRWRRTEALERQQAEEMKRQNGIAAEQRAEGLVPPPPPIPSSILSPRTGSVGSPGTYDGTGTEASTEYANNARRRRAERAQRAQAKQARQGHQVEFE
ncbi:MAG: hypothetical protein M1830_004697 [Pleopsidium flavum]|nr:MAG: hypothetical protein M1830_004697 [Pleopsidium flavum]